LSRGDEFQNKISFTLIISFLYHHFRVGRHSYNSRTAPSPARYLQFFMTHTFRLIFSLLIFTSTITCKNNSSSKEISYHKTEYSETQKRKYFQDSIAYRLYSGEFRQGDSLNNFTTFSKIMYPDIKAKNKTNPYLFAFEEPYIDTTKIDTTKSWLRIAVDPTFRTAFCIVIELKNNRTYLTLKKTDGEGGYYSGLLNFSVTKVYSDSLYYSISKLLHEANFWTLERKPNDTGCDATDADSWTFEAIEKGQYNIYELSDPLFCGSAETMKIGQIGKHLVEKVKSIKMASLKEIIPDN